MPLIRYAVALASVLFAVFAFAGLAHAGGGNYVFEGGTAAQQGQVRSALEASSFNWGLVSQQITIKIAPIGRDYSVPGEIFLDSDLLSAPGDYSWGVVQNEYANEVQFFLLPEQAHATFTSALGAAAWCYDDQPGLNMIQYGCERFASTLTWAYWQSPGNCIRPTATGGISGGMAPAAFKALLTSTLGVETETTAVSAQTVRYTTFQPAKPTTRTVSPATSAPTQAARAIQTVKVPTKAVKAVKTTKAAKAVFSPPLGVSIERVAPAQTSGLASAA